MTDLLTRKTPRLPNLLVIAASLFLMGTALTRAATLYWDANGTASAGGAPSGAGAVPTGTWGTDAFWTSDSSGGSATGSYAAGSDVVFAAGTDGGAYTVNLAGSQSANSVLFQDGTVTLLGAAASDTLTMANGGAITTHASTAYLRARLNGGGSSGITFNGTGTLFLQAGVASQNNGYTGTITIASGAVVLGGAGSLVFGANGAIKEGLVINAGAVFRNLAANIIADTTEATVNGAWEIGSNDAIRSLSGSGVIYLGTTLTVRPVNVARTFSGTIVGIGGLSFDNQSGGNTTQMLTGANYHTGATTFNAGTGVKLQLGHAEAIQFSAVTMNQANGLAFSTGVGTFRLAGLNGGANQVLEDTDSAAVMFRLAPVTTASYAGSLTGSGGVIKAGAGTQTFTASQAYTGATIVQQGTLVGAQTSGTPFGTGNVELRAGVLSLAPAGAGAAVELTGASATSSTTFTYAGGGTLSLNRGTNTSLSYTVGNAAPSVPVLQRAARGTLVITTSPAGALGASEKFVVSGLTSAANINGIHDAAVVSETGGVGTFTKYDTTAASGFVTAESGVSSYATHGASFTTAAGEIADVTASATITDGGAGSHAYALRVANGAVATLDGTVTINGAAAGAGSSGQAGVILNAGTITGGTLDFGESEGLIYTGAGASLISSAITGTAGVTKFGSGTLTLESANSFSGGLNINQGTLSFTSDSQLGAAGGALVLNGGTLSGVVATNGTTSLRGFSVGAAGGAIDIRGSNSALQLSGAMTGSGDLTITAQGATVGLRILTANNGYSGSISIASGRIHLNAAAANMGTGDVTIGTGTASLYISAGVTLANRFFIQSNGGENRGAIRLSSSNITLNGDIVLLANAGLGSDTGGASTNFINGDIIGTYTLTLGTLTASRSDHVFVLTGNNSHAGMVTGGVVRINGDSALGLKTGTLTFANAANSGTSGFGGTLQAGADGIEVAMTRSFVLNSGVNGRIDSQNFTLTVGSTISGAGNLVKVGTGLLILSGTSSHTGTTTVAAGTLQVGVGGVQDVPAYGSITTSAVSVNGTGAVLAGTGRILGAVTVTEGQIRAGDQTLTVDGRGTLTFGGTVTLAGAVSSIRFGLGGSTGNGLASIVNGTDVSGIVTNQPELVSGIPGNHDHLQFTDSGTLIWNTGGRLIIEFENGYTGGVGEVFNLMDWAVMMSTTGNYTAGTMIVGNGDEGPDLELPSLEGTGLYWNTMLLRDYGVLVMVPEPGRALLLLAGLLGLALRRRR